MREANMRTIAILSMVSLCGGCFVDRQCSTRPNDPFCQDFVDSARPDGGGNVDAHTTSCIPPCAGAEVCDPSSGLCVGCLSDANCTDPTMAACAMDTQSCSMCAMTSQCAHLPSTPVCHSGTCVQCNTNDDCDATHGCNASHMCVPVVAGSGMLCHECLRDSECPSGQLCVPMSYSGAVVGTFCAWRQDATGTGGPMDDCRNVRPMVVATMATSTDGIGAMMCFFRVSTCASQANFLNACTPGTATAVSPMCGPNMDGFCVHPTAECTVGCSNNVDCPCTTGTCASQYTCGGGFCSLSSTCNWDASMHTCH
jgi:hypothetical protein